VVEIGRKGNMVLGGLLLLLSIGVFVLFFFLPPYLTFIQRFLVLGVGFMLMIGSMGEMMRET